MSGHHGRSNGRVLVHLMQCDEGQATAPGSAVIVRDLATGVEREIATGPVFSMNQPAASPDGRHVASIRSDAVAKSQELLTVPSEGGTPRGIVRVAAPITLGGRLAWTADGRRLVVTRRDVSKSSLLLVPLDGGAAVEIELQTSDAQPTLHPDGRRLAFGRGHSEREVRVVDLKQPASA